MMDLINLLGALLACTGLALLLAAALVVILIAWAGMHRGW